MKNYKFKVKSLKKKDKELKKLFKKCKKCNKIKLVNNFEKHYTKDGLRNECKTCGNSRRRKTPIKPIAREGYKYCSRCNKELLLLNFNTRKGKPFSYCKECEREYNNNRYKHTCELCGKTYRSGRKDSIICNECNYSKVGKRGARILNSYDWSGENNPNYNPTLTDEERYYSRHRTKNPEYRNFVNEVLKRDNYTCQVSKNNKGKMIVHHLDCYSDFKDKRTDVNNGITLSEEIHNLYHKIYGYKHNTKEQFEEFLIRYNNKEFDEVA